MSSTLQNTDWWSPLLPLSSGKYLPASFPDSRPRRDLGGLRLPCAALARNDEALVPVLAHLGVQSIEASQNSNQPTSYCRRLISPRFYEVL